MFRILSSVLLATCLASSATAGEKWTVGQIWPAGQRVSFDEIDHASWNMLLARYVDERGNVNYTAWKENTADLRALSAYLAHLSQADVERRSSRAAQMAFWINAYNAVTIRGILREYPTDSIRNHTARVLGYNIWHDLLLQVGDSTISLDDIEHSVLRPMGDPRIHFAIVCASRSCPKLHNEAYTADRLDEQLADNAREFFANPLHFRYNAQRGTMQLSSILDWFGEDFGSNQREQLATIATYLPDDASRRLALSGSARVSYLDYDWGLNDQ